MKLSDKTLNVLKNYATINTGIVIKKGNFLRTISDNRTLCSEVEVDPFETDFAIYDLNDFLSVLSAMEEPLLHFNEKYVEIEDNANGGKTKYFYGSDAFIEHPKSPMKDIDVDFSFEITEKQLASFTKMSSILNLEEMVIKADGSKMTLGVVDSTNTTSNSYTIEIGNTDKVFSIYFRKDNFRMMPQDYQVSISKEFSGTRVAVFTNTTSKMKYLLAIEANSTVGE